jgi:TetR/AcrR family transcriptional repressor of nem operon
MRYPYDHKEKTRRTIVEAAERVFKLQGYRGAGVDAIMAEAGMTAGAFYKHFESKEALLREVLPNALERHADEREGGLEELLGLEWVRAMAHRYLSEEHLKSLETGCPLPGLVSEVGRASSETRDLFAGGIDRWSQQITEKLDALSPDVRVEKALGVIATMVGGMSVARAVDEQLAVKVLAGARRVVDESFASSESDEGPIQSRSDVPVEKDPSHVRTGDR